MNKKNMRITIPEEIIPPIIDKNINSIIS